MPQKPEKSLSQIMLEHGYIRTPTMYLPQEDYDKVVAISKKHKQAVMDIKHKWWDGSKRNRRD